MVLWDKRIFTSDVKHDSDYDFSDYDFSSTGAGSPVIKSGSARMKGHGFTNWTWRTKWLILKEQTLTIHNSQMSPWRTVIYLRDITKVDRTNLKPYCLFLETKHKKYWLSLKNGEELYGWQDSIYYWSSASGISNPADFVHQIHLDFDPITKTYQGSPEQWRKLFPSSNIAQDSYAKTVQKDLDSYTSSRHRSMEERGIDAGLPARFDEGTSPSGLGARLNTPSVLPKRTEKRSLASPMSIETSPRSLGAQLNAPSVHHKLTGQRSLAGPMTIETSPSSLGARSNTPSVPLRRAQQRSLASPGSSYDQPRALLLELAVSSVKRAQLSNLAGEKTQCIVDFLHKILDDHDNQIGPDERKRLLSLLSKLLRSAQVFPTCCQLQGVRCSLANPHNYGGFGFIYRGMYKSHSVCVKAVRLYSARDNQRNLRAHMKELALWAYLSHENILPFYGVYVSNETIPRVCTVSPWMRNGDLLAYLNDFPESPRIPLISDIIAGLQYLHESKIIHSDLKANNVLVSEAHRAMLTDFGISHVSMTLFTTTQSTSGTANWMAPELFEEDNAPVTEKSDIWAFGCVCYEIFTGEMPFSHYKNTAQLMFALIKGGITPLRPASRHDASEVEDRMWTLMERCWNYNPKERPKCDEIRQFIADLNFPDNRPPINDGAAFLDVKKARSNTKINYKQVYEILHEIQQQMVEDNSSTEEGKGKDGEGGLDYELVE